MYNIDCLYDESIDNESYNNNVFNKSLFSEVHSPIINDSSLFNNNNISLEEQNYFNKLENIQIPMNYNEFAKNVIIGEKSTNIKTNNGKNIPAFYPINVSRNWKMIL